jgi:hypothetical protein
MQSIGMTPSIAIKESFSIRSARKLYGSFVIDTSEGSVSPGKSICKVAAPSKGLPFSSRDQLAIRQSI